MTLFDLTRQLIDIPSLTGDEGAVGSFLASHLEGLGYRVETQEVAAGRFNVLATTDEAPRIVFSTHMDTVPPFIPSREDDEHIYGRGSCDAKGIIAAQIFAAERLRASGMNEVGFLFTVDEELGSEGAQAANNHPLARECRFLINGEPTDNLLAVGTKGSVRLFITTSGRAAHSAYPEAGESAIDKLLDILQNIRVVNWPEDSFFGTTTCNIGVLEGGTRPNVIPDHARAILQIRLGIDIE
ncbi:MAG TPA: M20/M25/M40 family metallo-hydrolase, partial [Pyrinomonadaceae bacterium]|nr:M20/M25/M40 family metallo-hydrolase [Pyrinomonadaceae bacterium]